MKFFYFFALAAIVLSFISCGNKASSLADVAEEDSLFIDTVVCTDYPFEADSLVEYH